MSAVVALVWRDDEGLGVLNPYPLLDARFFDFDIAMSVRIARI